MGEGQTCKINEINYQYTAYLSSVLYINIINIDIFGSTKALLEKEWM